MMTPEDEAAALFPCDCGQEKRHTYGCQVMYRDKVATALAAKDEHWRNLNDQQRMSDAEYYSQMITKRDATIDAQAKEIERLKTSKVVNSLDNKK